ncbi:hypothetical protein SAMN04488595_12233 [Ralstonia sp. 25mfcol4.1]|nr:hypothetical protein SAMN04488595_12233 [Ralstonia sp. 25mfcol4.1]
MSAEDRCAIWEGTNWFGKGRGLAVKKIGKLGALVADPSTDFADGKPRRADHANRSAHHTPVVLSARQKHPTGSARPSHLVHALMQPPPESRQPVQMSSAGRKGPAPRRGRRTHAWRTRSRRPAPRRIERERGRSGTSRLGRAAGQERGRRLFFRNRRERAAVVLKGRTGLRCFGERVSEDALRSRHGERAPSQSSRGIAGGIGRLPVRAAFIGRPC